MNYQLYLVTNRYNDSDTTFLQHIEQACGAGVTLVQLREKDVSTGRYYDLAQQVKTVTDRYHVPLIIDDRIDVCQAVDAAGVHIGDADLPVDVARQLLGPDKILGVSAKSVARAEAAAAAGADYLGVGAIYPTQTKVVTHRTSIDTLKAIITAVNIPVVAIGGIKEHRLNTFTDIPIAGVAVVSEIMQAPNVITKVHQLRETLKGVMA